MLYEHEIFIANKLKVLIILAVFALIPLIPPSFACSCSAVDDWIAKVNEAKVVFTGTVVSNKVVEHQQTTVIDVHHKIKGNVPDIVTVESMTIDSCTVNFKEGSTYRYVSYGETTLNTGVCSTKEISTPELLFSPWMALGNYFPSTIPVLAIIAAGIIVPSIVFWRKYK